MTRVWYRPLPSPLRRISASRAQEPDYWPTTLKYIVSDPKFVGWIKAYRGDNIPQHIIDKLQPYLTKEDFQARLPSLCHPHHPF